MITLDKLYRFPYANNTHLKFAVDILHNNNSKSYNDKKNPSTKVQKCHTIDYQVSNHRSFIYYGNSNNST